MLARRLLIALALLMAITALAAGLAPRESAHREDASPTPSTSAAPEAEPVEATLDAASEGQLVKAEVGQIVRIVVNTDELDSVQLGDLGTETADPDSPARFELLADEPGTYPIELLEAERQIGELEISD
ncbi:MAG TPA: hypothetical protein VKB28_21460 [Solirubrobacteraceae bacterium]|nr:hypothetical protein [Solirubrobacteraceae bacterium]